MQTIPNPLYILLFIFFCGVGFILGLIIQNEISWRKSRNNVLKAIKDLNLEDELARCPFGLNAKLLKAIKIYLHEHNLPDPFFGQGAVCNMILLIVELRKKGKIKPLDLDEKSGKLCMENPIELSTSEFSEDAFQKWLAKWGFRKDINMLQLMQYRIDNMYQGDLSQLLKESIYERPAANEYLVTIHGEYVFTDSNRLAMMEAEFYAKSISPSNHLIAIPKDWVDEMLKQHPELILTDV